MFFILLSPLVQSFAKTLYNLLLDSFETICPLIQISIKDIGKKTEESRQTNIPKCKDHKWTNQNLCKIFHSNSREVRISSECRNRTKRRGRSCLIA